MFEVKGDKLKRVELHEDVDELLLAKGNIGWYGERYINAMLRLLNVQFRKC